MMAVSAGGETAGTVGGGALEFDAQKTAARLLKQQMGVQDIAIGNTNELTVRDSGLETGAAVRLFVEAGLTVSDAHLYEETLEDYFKKVTGGEGIA